MGRTPNLAKNVKNDCWVKWNIFIRMFPMTYKAAIEEIARLEGVDINNLIKKYVMQGIEVDLSEKNIELPKKY
jgi:hypothetical protein